MRHQAHVRHKPWLLSDNGSSYVSGDLAEWLDKQRMDHTLGAPYHPQIQDKIERWHQTLKSRILLENYYLPGDLEAQIGRFIEHYNHQCYHESLENMTPADIYFGRGQVDPVGTTPYQTENHRTSSLASPQARRLQSTNQMSPTLR